MTPVRLMRQEAILTRRSQTGPADVYGSPTWVETETPVRCWTHPVGSDEIEERPAGRLTHRGYFPPDVTIQHQDRLTLATGQGWEIDGPGRPWIHPVTNLPVYIECDLVEVQ